MLKHSAITTFCLSYTYRIWFTFHMKYLTEIRGYVSVKSEHESTSRFIINHFIFIILFHILSFINNIDRSRKLMAGCNGNDNVNTAKRVHDILCLYILAYQCVYSKLDL